MAEKEAANEELAGLRERTDDVGQTDRFELEGVIASVLASRHACFAGTCVKMMAPLEALRTARANCWDARSGSRMGAWGPRHFLIGQQR